MHVRSTIMVCVLGAVLAASAGAEIPDTNPQAISQFAPSVDLLNSGLLDFSRFDVSHSLSYSFTSASRVGSQSGGLWLTELGYRISDPLRISVDVGAVINTTGNGSLLNENNIFLSGFNLDYTPSKNFRLNISFVNPPPNGAPGYLHQRGSLRTHSPWGIVPGLDR